MAVQDSSGGAAYPGDMEALKRIYDELCREYGFRLGTLPAEDLAKATMDLFGQGIFDEDEIRDSLRRFLSRRPMN